MANRQKEGGFAYLQLYHQLRQDIVGGRRPFGSRMPSKRTMSAESGLSVVTVEHAYAILCDEGYLESRPRSGFFVIYREGELLAMPPASVGPPRRQYSDYHSDFPFSVMARAMRRVLAERGAEILSRCPGQGSEELRQELCGYLLRNSGIAADAGQIVVGAGAEYLYGVLAQLFAGKRFALEQPGYEQIRQVYESFGVAAELLPLTDEGIDTLALRQSEAQVLHVTPFNSYPSGVTATASKRREYLRWAAKRGGWIVEDNYDSELTVSKKREDSLFSQSEGDRVIYLNTFSQTISPALRVAYMVLPRALADRYREQQGFRACPVPVFEQLVLAELLRNGDFERHINRVRRAKRRALQG